MIQENNTPNYQGRRIIAAMSGGVDSSLMAAMLKEQGAEVVGVFLHVWDYSREEGARQGSCCATEDAYDARRVADKLGIAFYSMDMQQTFRDHVIDPFIADYESGRTPNPCERCNRFVKFGALLEAADQLDAEFVATGHYLQRRDDAEGVRVFRGADRNKDQSYFLATTSREQVSRILFPVGHLQKEETRKLALSFDLPTANKPESQDICFIPNGDRIAFLKSQDRSAGLVPGEIVNHQGHILGGHQGIARYTIGQRKGLNLAGGPWNVIKIDSVTAQITVAPSQTMRTDHIQVAQVAWIRQPLVDESILVKTRYRTEPAHCTIHPSGEQLSVMLAEPQAPTAPGQVAAFYQGDELLGGGIIEGSQCLQG
ncbi:MAG: tRNA 2-thiouridine(34) synthase MnmA [Mariprofundaceae bacterium]